jgi:hypothetical protein
MATEINKNKKWTSFQEVKKRRRKVSNQTDINNIKSVISSFISAVKVKHA